MNKFYDAQTEALMQLHMSRQTQKGKRQYAAIESQKLGFGGKMYISNLFKMSRKTLNKGILELIDESYYQQIPIGKQRRKGGGRKKKFVIQPL